MGDQLQVENWVTVKDVQAYLGVGRETILQWISKRKNESEVSDSISRRMKI